MLIKITFEQTVEAAAEAVASAGGRGTNDEIASHISETRFRQRVHTKNSVDHIAGMWVQGYRVVDVTIA